MAKKEKFRLDARVLELFPELNSKTYVQSLILQGKVFVDNQQVVKAGHQVTAANKIRVEHTEKKYVCRAGYKLEKALDYFDINVTDLVAMDAGLSTGGFTDCMLQRGIKRVYGIDVGYGQVDYKIRSNERVIVMERTNLRYLSKLPEPVDLVTLDLSFISVLKVLDSVNILLKGAGLLLVLIKPQFEARREEVGPGGIIVDSDIHTKVTKKVIEGICQANFDFKGMTDSPILGSSGNKEFLAYFIKKD